MIDFHINAILFYIIFFPFIHASTVNKTNVLIVYYNDPGDKTRTVAKSIASGAEKTGASVQTLEVSQANYKRDVANWADALILGSGVYNGNAHPDILSFINSFDFMDDLSNKVGGAFATGGAPSGKLTIMLVKFFILSRLAACFGAN